MPGVVTQSCSGACLGFVERDDPQIESRNGTGGFSFRHADVVKTGEHLGQVDRAYSGIRDAFGIETSEWFPNQ